MVVDRERDDGGEAMAVSGPRQERGAGDAAAVEKAGEDERDGDGEDEERKEEEEEAAEDVKEKELEEWSEIRLAIAELSPISRGGKSNLECSSTSSPPTLPFLSLSLLLLQMLDKIGPTMAVLRLDVQRNIERLQELYLLDPSKYSTLTSMVEKEAEEGTARKADSCARAILWLTRSMDFTIELLQRLEGECSDQQSLIQLVEAAYNASLKPWHGWISSAASKIAMKLIPEKKIFVGWLVGTDTKYCGVLKDEIETLVQLLQPFLVDIHATLAKFRLDRLKST